MGMRVARRTQEAYGVYFPALFVPCRSSQIARCVNVSLCLCFVLRTFEAAAKRMRGKFKHTECE